MAVFTYKNQKGSSILSVIFAAAIMLIISLILTSQMGEQRKQTSKRNHSPVLPAIARNITSHIQLFSSVNAVSAFSYYPQNFSYISSSGRVHEFSSMDPREGFPWLKFTYKDDKAPIGVREGSHHIDEPKYKGIAQANARFTQSTHWRQPATFGNFNTTDWLFNNSLIGSPERLGLNQAVNEFLLTKPFHFQARGAGYCASNGMNELCEKKFHEDAAKVMISSTNTWPLLDTNYSRFTYLYNKYSDFCEKSGGIQIIKKSQISIDDWVITEDAHMRDLYELIQNFFPSSIIKDRLSDAESLDVFLEIKEMDPVTNKESCENQSKLVALASGLNLGASDLAGKRLYLKLRIVLTYVDESGSEQQKNHLESILLSPTPVGSQPRVSSIKTNYYRNLGDEALDKNYRSDEVIVVSSNSNPDLKKAYLSGYFSGENKISSPTVEVEAEIQGLVASPYCRLERLRPQDGSKYLDDFRLFPVPTMGPSDSPEKRLKIKRLKEMNKAIEWSYRYTDSGWFLCSMPPRNLKWGYDWKLLDSAAPFELDSSKLQVNKLNLAQIWKRDARAPINIYNFQGIVTNRSFQIVKFYLKDLPEGQYRISFRAVDAAKQISEIASKDFKIHFGIYEKVIQ